MAESGEPMSEEEAQRAMWPTILELQKLLVERTRAVKTNGGDVTALSITSCDSQSCNNA